MAMVWPSALHRKLCWCHRQKQITLYLENNITQLFNDKLHNMLKKEKRASYMLRNRHLGDFEYQILKLVQ